MNSSILRANWVRMRKLIQERWSKLTSDELDDIDGNLDMLAGKLEQKYGEQRFYVEDVLDEAFDSIVREQTGVGR